jgi:outer membrane receptor protein involved in Fe transport
MAGVDITSDISFVFANAISASLHGQYSFERAMDYSKPNDNDPVYGTYKKQIAYVPLHSGSAAAEIGYKWFSFSYLYMYIGQRYENSVNISANSVSPLSLHDISFSFDFENLRSGTVSLRPTLLFEINNLLNRQYEIVKNFPMMGINFRVTLRLQIVI